MRLWILEAHESETNGLLANLKVQERTLSWHVQFKALETVLVQALTVWNLGIRRSLDSIFLAVAAYRSQIFCLDTTLDSKALHAGLQLVHFFWIFFILFIEELSSIFSVCFSVDSVS